MITSDTEPKAERSLGELLSNLATEAVLLLRQELELFKAEVKEKLGRDGRAGALVAAGGVILLSGWLALLAAAILALGLVLPWWAAALLVAAVALIVGFVILRIGMRQLSREDLTPHRTLSSLRTDAAWIRERVQ